MYLFCKESSLLKETKPNYNSFYKLGDIILSESKQVCDLYTKICRKYKWYDEEENSMEYHFNAYHGLSLVDYDWLDNNASALSLLQDLIIKYKNNNCFKYKPNLLFMPEKLIFNDIKNINIDKYNMKDYNINKVFAFYFQTLGHQIAAHHQKHPHVYLHLLLYNPKLNEH